MNESFALGPSSGGSEAMPNATACDNQQCFLNLVLKDNGGQRGIRTLDTVARIHAFQACAFSHSATCPLQAVSRLSGRNILMRRMKASIS